jgi:hypothetical protein
LKPSRCVRHIIHRYLYEAGLQIVSQTGSEIVNVLETARAQSRWNSYAAVAAALSAFLQAIALMAPK